LSKYLFCESVFSQSITIKDILTDTQTVRNFCEKFFKWMLCRETELERIRDINDRADKLKLNLSDCVKSEGKGQAFKKYFSNTFTQTGKQYAELEKELEEVLTDTLGGLEMLQSFLDAIEKLAVSSVHVFMENQVIQLPEDISFDYVQVVINNAKLICPLLLEFKRDTKVFFLPKMQNVEVIAYHLDRYIQTTKKMLHLTESLFHSCLNDDCLTMTEVVVKLDVNLSEVNMQKMLDHINQLKDIQMDQNFRTVFLFQEESCSRFMKEFSERQPRMLQFLKELEENAVQLDRMNKGAKISSVAGSSVGAVGGVLSIVGLALSPVTAGASFALTMTGLGMGVTSGVNSLVTTATELGVNRKHQTKANEVFQSFMEDVTELQECLEEVSRQANTKLEPSDIELAVGVTKVLYKVGGVGKSIDTMADFASAAKLLKSEELVSSAGKVVVQEGASLRSVSRVAADVPDIGQAAVKSSLTMTKSARALAIGTNALFLGMDIFYICTDSISLYKGSETEVSKFIRARAALWSSEMDSWKKIHDSLSEGLQTSEKKEALLETLFYLNTDVPVEHGNIATAYPTKKTFISIA
uniref:Apolipoprotein L n=1 Tax=Oryzias melastigma TaxID=30732 RepID=A0A3B3CFD8_ORYME